MPSSAPSSASSIGSATISIRLRTANTSVLQGREVEPDLSVIHDARAAIESALAQLRGALMVTPIIGSHDDDPASLAEAG